MKCPICNKEGARLLRVTRTYGKAEKLVLIENVPVITCPNCGESYLSAETLHEIERLKRSKRGERMRREVEVMTFAGTE